MIKLMIAIPTAGMVGIETTYCLANACVAMTRKPPPFEFGWALSTACGSNWIENREKLADTLLEREATHLCFIDDDMVFSDAVIPRLVSRIYSDKLDIVTVNYMVKEEPPTTFTAIGLDGSRVRTTAESQGIEEVAANGFGVSIISAEVFRKVPKPWFMPTWTKDHGYSTEDVPFFRKAREAGFKVYVDHDASKAIAHAGRKQWSWKHAV